MLTVYIDFSKEMLYAVSQWLMSEPINYVFGGVVFCFVIKGFSRLVGF